MLLKVKFDAQASSLPYYGALTCLKPPLADPCELVTWNRERGG